MRSDSSFQEQRIDHFEARNDSVSDCANKLRELGVRVCSLEDLSGDQRQPLVLSGATLAQILDRIVERNPGYHWDEPCDALINIFPSKSVLESEVFVKSVGSKGVLRFLEDDLHIGALGILLYEEFGDPDGPLVKIGSQYAHLRDALNSVVEQLESMIWHIAGRPGAYYLSFTTVPTNASSSEATP